MSYRAMFFNSWPALERTLIMSVLVYLAMVFMLRIAGKRTLSRMTPFDMIIPLTLGPIMASTILMPDVALAQGLLAFSTLIGLHWAMAWLTSRSHWVRTLVKREPRLLFHQGEFLRGAMLSERVSEEEIREAIRAAGIPSLTDVEAVVLEADGSYNVVHRIEAVVDSSLKNVVGYEALH